MGSESSKSYSYSNSFKSDSESSSNSGLKNGKLEEMNFQQKNENATIKRVWIIKKSITIHDTHIYEKKGFFYYHFLIKFEGQYSKPIELDKPKVNIFNIKGEFNKEFKHWAIILELNNNTYINIQFGRNGFSLKEFNQTDVDGESLLNSITETWGEQDAPCSFCYLGNSNYEYKKLKQILKEKKNKELEIFKEKGTIYYNLCFRNCQHFACDIEKILFGKIQVWHSFDYYLEQFYEKFFPSVNLSKLKLQYEKELKRINAELFKKNFPSVYDLEKIRPWDKESYETIEKWKSYAYAHNLNKY